MEGKLENMVQGLVLSLLLVNVASSALHEDFVRDSGSSDNLSFKPSLSPLSASTTINQVTGGGGTSFTSSLCQAFVTQYGRPIADALMNSGQQPQQICSQFGMCMAIGGSTGGVPTGGFGLGFSQMLCGPCQVVVTMMQQSLNKMHSQGQGDPVSVYGSQLCQSVSNVFRNPALMYSPPTTIQSVSGEEMFKQSPNDAINV